MSCSLSFSSEKSGSSPQSKILENIGRQVLSQWNISDDEISSDLALVERVTEVLTMLDKPVDSLPEDWEKKIRDLLNQLTPADYATYGKSLCFALLSLKSRQIIRSSEMLDSTKAVASPVNKGNQDDQTQITAVSKLDVETSATPILRKKKIKVKSVSPSELYSKFPEWLSTSTKFN